MQDTKRRCEPRFPPTPTRKPELGGGSDGRARRPVRRCRHAGRDRPASRRGRDRAGADRSPQSPADAGASDADALTTIAAAGQRRHAERRAEAGAGARRPARPTLRTKGAAPADPQAAGAADRIRQGWPGARRRRQGCRRIPSRRGRPARQAQRRRGRAKRRRRGRRRCRQGRRRRRAERSASHACQHNPRDHRDRRDRRDRSAPAQVQAQAAAVPLSGLAVEIATQAHAGKQPLRNPPRSAGARPHRRQARRRPRRQRHHAAGGRPRRHARPAQARRLLARTRAAAGRPEDLRQRAGILAPPAGLRAGRHRPRRTARA